MFIEFGSVTFGISLSWDGGTNWTTEKTVVISTKDPTDSTKNVGSSIDPWGHTWTKDQLSNANFRVRVRVISFGGSAVSCRVDNIKARVNFSSSDIKLEGGVKTNKVVLTG